jgi:hypothetical protein
MTFKEWITSQPSKFPEFIGHHTENTPYQNPLIGEDQAQTYENVVQIIDFIIQMALSSYTEPVSFSMDEDATWGFINILECMAGAMKFEKKFRKNGGLRDEDKAKDKKKHESTEQDVSFKPYHGQSFSKYRIFLINADDSIKQLGTILAPNEVLAFTRAKKNYASALKDGCSIFVRETPIDDGGKKSK